MFLGFKIIGEIILLSFLCKSFSVKIEVELTVFLFVLKRPSVKWTVLEETRVPVTKAGRGTVYTATPGQSAGTICSVTRTPRVGATPPTTRSVTTLGVPT